MDTVTLKPRVLEGAIDWCKLTPIKAMKRTLDSVLLRCRSSRPDSSAAYRGVRCGVVLQVRSDGSIGKELAFSPPMMLNPFSINPVITELIERVDRARNT